MLDILDKIMYKTGWPIYETAFAAGMGLLVLLILYGIMLSIIEVRRRSIIEKYDHMQVFLADQAVSIFQRYDFLFACAIIIAGILSAIGGVFIGAWYLAATQPDVFKAIQGFKL